ncbi:MAG: superoxide dismutase [Alphaproteobacteria bacterium]|nr:superoxide dismutase [Alphaproteobacteria bacterium]
MTHAITPLAFKPSRLDGLSAKLVSSHYVNNYGGAVRRLNAIEARLAALDLAAEPGFVVNGIAREALIAHNSMVLHEVHFDGLGGTGAPGGAVADALARDFQGVERWQRAFAAMGKALAGGSGWVILAWSRRANRLVNQWAADHAHVLADAEPILALDMYEHAYHQDFGADAGRYVDTVLRNLHWGRISARYEMARARRTVSPAAAGVPVEAVLADRESVLLVDVRLPDDYAASGLRMPGVAWHDPSRVEEWGRHLSRGRRVVVSCVYGFEVSLEAAAALRRLGFDADILSGGLAAWRAAGGPVEPI